MATGRKPPQNGKTGARPHASYLRVGCGQSARAYVAGEMHGVTGHRTHGHQPCLSDYTDGAMQCPFCAAGLEQVWRAYVPVWDVDWALRYVLIGKDIAESVDVIERGEQVTISRARNPISPLIVRHAPGLMRELPRRAPWETAVDMEAICLMLWGNDALSQWASKRGRAVRQADAPEVLRSDGKPFTPMLRGGAKRYAPPTDPQPADAAYDAVTARLKGSAARLKPSKNGTHKEGDHA